MIHEALEIFVILKNKLLEVTKADLLKEGIDRPTYDSLISKGLIEEDGVKLSITKKGEDFLISHREGYLHDRLIDKGASLPEGGAPEHWRRCHRIDSETLAEFYQRLRHMPYHIEDLVPLEDLPEGKMGEIILMVGGKGMTRRLCEMGLTPGAKVRMTKKAPIGGPIILEVRSTEIAIGRGLASKILVKPES